MKKDALRPISALLLALLAVMPLAWASESHAQAMPQSGASAAGGMKQIEGAIKSVDSSGRMVTLDDGTQLTIPPTVNVPRESLKEGAIVKASFEEKGGQKVVTSLEVQKK
jgi:Cu/Ag efflux protein CusF